MIGMRMRVGESAPTRHESTSTIITQVHPRSDTQHLTARRPYTYTCSSARRPYTYTCSSARRPYTYTCSSALSTRRSHHARVRCSSRVQHTAALSHPRVRRNVTVASCGSRGDRPLAVRALM